MDLNKNIVNLNSFDISKKSICLVISSGLSFRNIMLDSSLNSLSKLNDKYNIVFITEERFQNSYPNKINLIQIPSIRNKLAKLINKLLNFYSHGVFDKLNQTNTKRILPKLNHFGSIYGKAFARYKFIFIKSESLYKILRKINNLIILKFSPDIKNQILKLNPKYVIGFDALSNKEYVFLIHASKICKTASVIKSFDNITSKGYLPYIPKKIFVWNKQMVSEGEKTYSKYNSKIYAIGAPQYDHIKGGAKEKLKRSNQILYCTNISFINKYDQKIIDILEKFAKKNNFKLLLRIHQTDNINRWLKYKGKENIEIYPDKMMDNDPNTKCSDKDHQPSLNKQIRESFVVIASYSSLIYDSLALNTPIINLGYDLNINNSDWKITMCEKFDHIKSIINFKCVDNIRSQKELLEKIIYRYKNGFTYEEEKDRQKFIKDFLGPNLENYSINNLISLLNL